MRQNFIREDNQVYVHNTIVHIIYQYSYYTHEYSEHSDGNESSELDMNVQILGSLLSI